MMRLKKEFQGVAKEIDVLTGKTRELTEKFKKKAFDQLEKAQAAVKPEVAARHAANAMKKLKAATERLINAAETFEREQAAKAGAKVKAKPKTKPKAKKTPAGKKTGFKKQSMTLTATDQVLKVVRNSKKGVDVPTLAKKTGFRDKQVRNIVFRALKQGKIKRVGRGLYAGA